MQVVCGKLLECCGFCKDLCTFLRFLFRILFWCRTTREVISSKTFRISMNWSFRMHKCISKVLKVTSIVKDTSALSNELIILFVFFLLFFIIREIIIRRFLLLVRCFLHRSDCFYFGGNSNIGSNRIVDGLNSDVLFHDFTSSHATTFHFRSRSVGVGMRRLRRPHFRFGLKDCGRFTFDWKFFCFYEKIWRSDRQARDNTQRTNQERVLVMTEILYERKIPSFIHRFSQVIKSNVPGTSRVPCASCGKRLGYRAQCCSWHTYLV